MVSLTGPADSFRLGVAATLCGLLWLAAPSALASGPVGPNNPVILAQATSAAAPSALDAAIRETVSAWAKAWSARDVDAYLGFYAPAFDPGDGQSRSAWEKLRRARVGGPRFIEVTISDVTVLRRDDARAAATFGQKYRSDRYQDSVTKTLEFVRDGTRWLIVAERSGPAVAQAEAAPAKAEAKAAPTPKAEPKPEAAPKSEPAAAAAAPVPAPAPAPAAKRGISAGLGTLQVLSNLGEPLRAEIDLLSLRANQRENVTARLAPIEMFREAGIDFHHALSDLKLAIELRDGKPIILLTTTRRVNEPLLELIVELEWGSGRFVREYAILLDPPTYIPPPPADAVMGPTPSAAAMRKPEPPATAAAPSAPGAAARAAGAEYTVVPGDTLAEIASKRRYPEVTLDQMMIGLYRANPDAFIDGDINLLRAGHVLTIPDRDTVAAFDAEEANAAVLAEMARSPESRRAIAATAPSAPGVPGARPAQKPTPAADQVKLARKEKEKAAEPPAAASKADDRAAIERALAEAQARITELERIYADLQKLLVIKDQQIAALEKRIAEMRAAPGAAVLAKPAAEAPKPAPVEKPAAEAPKPAPVEKPAAEAPKPAPVEKPAAEAPKPAPVEKPAAEAPKPAPVEKPAAEAPKPAPKPQPKPAAKPQPAPPPPAPEPGLVERYIGDLGDPVMLVGLVGVALLLVGYGAYAWRRKKREARSQLSESLRGAVEGTPAATPAAGVAAAAAVTDEADPLEEADVYIAYGRDAQAEELLREAVQAGDNRPVVFSKLLQIYAKQHDTDRFEATALKLKGLLSEEAPEWEKAMALGRSIDPGNSLYGRGEAEDVAPAAAPAAAEEPEVDFDLDAVMATGEMPAVTSEPATPATVDFAIDTTSTGVERPAEDAGLDFDLGTATTEEPVPGEAPAAEAEEAAPSLGTIDFDLGGITTEMPAVTGTTPPPAPPAATPPAEATEEAPEHIALEFDLGETGAEEATPAEAAPAAEAPPATGAGGLDEGLSFDLSETEAAPPSEEKAEPTKAEPAKAESQLDTISFDLGGGETAAPTAGGGDAKWQEVTTKLQLAKSFEEIGDNEGARELLQEVIAEGDAAQRAHAEKMLAGLG